MSDKYEVHCGRCNWWGRVDQMRLIYNTNPSKPGDVIPELGCPKCSSDQWLENDESGIVDAMYNLIEKREALLETLVKLREVIATCQISQSLK